MVLTVTGDSMEPTLRSGDKLLVDSTRNNPAVPGLYVMAFGDMAVVKRIELIPGSNPARLRISSDNQLHHAYETDAALLKSSDGSPPKCRGYRGISNLIGNIGFPD